MNNINETMKELAQYIRMQEEISETIEGLKDQIKAYMQQNKLETLSNLLDMIDCYFVGETYCLDNYETGHTVYNAYSDLTYVFAWSEIQALEAGKAVKLFAKKPDETDKEILEKEGF